MSAPTLRPPFALFEDNLSVMPHAVLLQSLQRRLTLPGDGDAGAFFAQIEAAQASGLWVALAADYELGLQLEPHLRPLLRPLRPKSDKPLATAWLFADCTRLAGDALAAWWAAQLDGLDASQREAGLLQLSPTLDAQGYGSTVARALAYIQAGDCYQVNLTFACRLRHYGHPLALFARLRETQAVAHGVLIADGDEWLLSRSPELFVARSGETLHCRPMKGTAARSPRSSTAQDAQIGEQLQHSEKNRAENLMIVDLIRNDLGRLVPPGGVQVDQLFALETYNSVYQLTSSISATPVNADLHSIMQALFPCGSVTGAPKIRAMQIIAELETAPRGIYCGALGWLAPDGDLSLNVPIRTLQLNADGSGTLNVGSGIVADSIASAEHAECLDKAAFARSLRDGLHLIETMRCESGSIALLARHMARLARSATELGWMCNVVSIQAEVEAYCSALADGTWRLRLTLSPQGELALSHAPLDPLPAQPGVSLHPHMLDPQDQRLRYKTTARALYDDALKTAVADGHFDTLFFNTRGELCEGARSNVFVMLDGQLWTPPLACGLLPGVMRESLIESGRALERVLRREDLQRAPAVYVANALRGLIEVRLVQEEAKRF